MTRPFCCSTNFTMHTHSFTLIHTHSHNTPVVQYPYRSAYEDGTLFQGFGLGDCLNANFTFPTFNASDHKHPFNRDLHTYLTDYAEAGWKMFRWSNGWASTRHTYTYTYTNTYTYAYTNTIHLKTANLSLLLSLSSPSLCLFPFRLTFSIFAIHCRDKEHKVWILLRVHSYIRAMQTSERE